MYAMKAMLGNLSVIQNTCPNPSWFDDFMKTYELNRENGEETYFYMKLRQTGNGERMWFYHMTGSKFHDTFRFIGEESPLKMTPITTK